MTRLAPAKAPAGGHAHSSADGGTAWHGMTLQCALCHLQSITTRVYSAFFLLQLALSPASAIRSANCSAVGRRRCRPLAVALGGPGSVLSWAIVGVRAKKPSRGLVFSFPLLYLCGRWVAFRCGRQWPGGSPQMISRCSKLIAIKLCAISEMHGKVRRESVAGYATDETLACGPKEHTRWWQRYR